MATRIAHIHLAEWLKNRLQLIFGDTDSRIHHLDQQHIRRTPDLEPHRAVVSKLAGVVQ